MGASKSNSGFRPVSPAFLFLDIVPVVPESVRTRGFYWSLDTPRDFYFGAARSRGGRHEEGVISHGRGIIFLGRMCV
jgi:hypothetical protein